MIWEDMLLDVLPFVPDCPDEMAIRQGLRHAAREFCQRTLAWNFTTEATLVDATTGEYVLEMDDGLELVKIIAADANGYPYTTRRGSLARQAIRLGDKGFLTQTGLSPFNKPQLMLSPVPTGDCNCVNVEIAVQPSMAAETWPDDLAEHAQCIAWGAVARLASMPKRTWTDAPTAQQYRAMFNDRVGAVAASLSLENLEVGRGSRVQWR